MSGEPAELHLKAVPPVTTLQGPAVPRPTPATVQPLPPTRVIRHLRAAGLIVFLTVLLAGLVIPVIVTGFADLVTPGTANGSLLRHNGTIIGSSLVAQNLSTPFLFWERPSLTDYNILNGTVTPPGPSEPALVALIGQTIMYMRFYGNYTVNASVPLSLVGPSSSDLDPDLTPQAVLVQIPRISAHTVLSIGTLLMLVNTHIVNPFGTVFGPSYVNVLELDLALLPLEGR
jgi:K+-transporting ATPase ATPase C chain